MKVSKQASKKLTKTQQRIIKKPAYATSEMMKRFQKNLLAKAA